MQEYEHKTLSLAPLVVDSLDVIKCSEVAMRKWKDRCSNGDFLFLMWLPENKRWEYYPFFAAVCTIKIWPMTFFSFSSLPSFQELATSPNSLCFTSFSTSEGESGFSTPRESSREHLTSILQSHLSPLFTTKPRLGDILFYHGLNYDSSESCVCEAGIFSSDNGQLVLVIAYKRRDDIEIPLQFMTEALATCIWKVLHSAFSDGYGDISSIVSYSDHITLAALRLFIERVNESSTLSPCILCTNQDVDLLAILSFSLPTSEHPDTSQTPLPVPPEQDPTYHSTPFPSSDESSPDAQCKLPTISPSVRASLKDILTNDVKVEDSMNKEDANLSIVEENSHPAHPAIFLLVGQSNMSGRGDKEEFADSKFIMSQRFGFVDESIQKEDDEDIQNLTNISPTRALYFDHETGWKPIDTSMHGKVDILKQVGVGPGNSFAVKMNRLLGEGKQVLLIPAAVGSSYLHEWQPDYRAVLSDSNIPACCKDGFLLTPPNAAYHSLDPTTFSCPNLFSAALRCVYKAFKSLTKKSHCSITGVLWFQGENDASLPTEAAAKYGQNFAHFVQKLRHHLCQITNFMMACECRIKGDNLLSSPLQVPIPIVTAAITSTRVWLKEQRLIREQQLSYSYSHAHTQPRTQSSSSQSVTSEDEADISVIDTFGSVLKPDCIHLCTSAQIDLGFRFAREMARLLSRQHGTCRSKQLDESLHLTSDLCSDWELIYERARKQAETVLEDVNKNEAAAFPQPPKVNNDGAGSRGTLQLLRCGLKPVNFVYGELSFRSFCKVLRIAGITSQNEVFVDLGCGSGTCIAAAALMKHISCRDEQVIGFSRVIGIDLMSSKINDCLAMVEQLRLACRNSSTNDSSNDDNLPQIDVKLGNFIQEDNLWIDADVVYSCSTCFADDLISALISKFLRLRIGARIILMDSTVLSSDITGNAYKSLVIDKTTDKPIFEMIGSCQCVTSWGIGNAYVYRKVL